MKVLNGYQDVPAACQGAALAIGNFDGVHHGHQALLNRAKAWAKANYAPAGVMIFEPHPKEFFQPDAPHFRLTPREEKIDIFQTLGLDLAVAMPFDNALAQLSADAFCQTVLVDALKVRHIVIGYDFFFGRGRSGSAHTLQDFGARHGYSTDVVPPVTDAGDAFSSTEIRLRLAQGDVKGAARMMGRWWRVSGSVVGGAHRGTGLGFPTANIPLPKGTALAHGIYAVRIAHEDSRYDGAAYLGTRPTFDDGRPVLEVFLFDFDGDLYGKEIMVSFIDHLRPDRKFDSAEALIAQMQADCAEARTRLKAAPPAPV